MLLTIDRLVIEAADMRRQVVLFERAGEVLLRHEPTDSPVPNVPGGGQNWTNHLYLELPEAPALTVRVVDKLKQKACLWDISAAGEVGKARKE